MTTRTHMKLLLALGLAASVLSLAWHWEPFAVRSWSEGTRALAFTDDGRFLVSLDRTGWLRRHELANPFDRLRGARRAVATDRVLVRALSAELVMTAGREATFLETFEHGGTIRVAGEPFDASLESDVLVTGDDEGRLVARRLSRPSEILWETRRDRIWRTIYSGGGPDYFLPANPSLSSDGSSIAVPGSASVTIHDARTGAAQKTVAIPRHVYWLGRTAAGDLLIEGIEKVTWLAPDGTPREKSVSFTGATTFSLEGDRLVAHGLESTLVHDTRTGELLGTFPSPAAVSPDGTRVAHPTPDGELVVVPLR